MMMMVPAEMDGGVDEVEEARTKRQKRSTASMLVEVKLFILINIIIIEYLINSN